MKRTITIEILLWLFEVAFMGLVLCLVLLVVSGAIYLLIAVAKAIIMILSE